MCVCVCVCVRVCLQGCVGEDVIVKIDVICRIINDIMMTS